MKLLVSLGTRRALFAALIVVMLSSVVAVWLLDGLWPGALGFALGFGVVVGQAIWSSTRSSIRLGEAKNVRTGEAIGRVPET